MAVQCNNAYESKMHINRGHQGPSAIMQLGEYFGGDPWIIDPTERMDVKEATVSTGRTHPMDGKIVGRGFRV